MKKQGPNVKKLIAHRMSTIMIPPGGGFKDGVKALLDIDGLKKVGKEASAWVEEAIALVKQAPDNPYGDDDEAIAGEILRQVELKNARLRENR